MPPLAVFAIVAVLLGIGLGLNPRLVPSPLIDKPAPAFNLPEVYDSTRGMTLGDFGGEPVLLNVFASWWAACRGEHPLLMELAREGAGPVYGLY